MNKLYSKVAALSVGLALAAGVGVGIGAKSARVAKASGTAVSASEVVSGERYFIVADGKVLKAGSVFAAKKSGDVTATYDGEGLGESDAWVFTKSSDVWTITTEVNSVTQYLYCTNDNNGLVCGTASNENTTKWTITATGEEETTSFLKSTDGTNDRYLALYATTPNFRIYKTTSSGVPQIQLYHYTASSKTVSSLAVVSNPTKTAYTEGDALDLTGVSIKAIWSDSTETDVTSDAIYSPANGATLSVSDTQVTVTYGGKSTTISLTVAAKVFSTSDMYITAEALSLTTSYGSTDVTLDHCGDSFTFGRKDVMKGINDYAGSIQLKASTGSLYNKSKFSAPISKVYLLAKASAGFAPSNYAVYGHATEAGSKTQALEIETEDETNRIYSVDFSGFNYFFFTLAKTGSYATYFDMIVVELVHSADDVAAVRSAADNMLNVFAQFCQAAKGPSASQWEEIAGYYDGLTPAQKTIFDGAVLNTFACSSSDPFGAPVQATSLQKAVQKIEYCVSAYGVENFTGRTIPSSAFVGYNLGSNIENNTIIIVIAIASISALAFTMLLVFKRRNKNN